MLEPDDFVPTKTPTSSIGLIIEAYRGMVTPEPIEQSVFAILAVLLPILALILVVTSARPWRIAEWRHAGLALPSVIAVLFLSTLVESDFIPTVVFVASKLYSILDTSLLTVALLGAAWLCLRTTRRMPAKAGAPLPARLSRMGILFRRRRPPNVGLARGDLRIGSAGQPVDHPRRPRVLCTGLSVRSPASPWCC